jgi:hypothetical protein
VKSPSTHIVKGLMDSFATDLSLLVRALLHDNTNKSMSMWRRNVYLNVLHVEDSKCDARSCTTLLVKYHPVERYDSGVRVRFPYEQSRIRDAAPASVSLLESGSGPCYR